MAIELTDRVVRDAEPPVSGMRIIWDDLVKGLGCRITKAGAKAFILTYRASGVQRSLTIGSYPDWSANLARERAKELKRQVDVGEDPMLQRHPQHTITDLANHYIKVHLSKKRPGSQLADRLNLLKHILPRIGDLKLIAITQTDLVILHQQISEKTPFAANRMLALLSKMLNLAKEADWIRANPARGIIRNKETPRERVLSLAEIARLVEVLKAYPKRPAANAIYLLLLTGSRRNEVLEATWPEFNLDYGIWTIPSDRTKQNRTHRIPLNTHALSLLRAIKAEQDRKLAALYERGITYKEPTKFVFPSKTPKIPLRNINGVWTSVCEQAAIKNCRLHDLRHTFTSVLGNNGQSQLVASALIGTRPTGVDRYMHLTDDTLKQATELAGRIISQ